MLATQKILKRATIVLSLMVFVVAFNACTFYSDFYLRNHLNENVIVQALLEEPLDDLYRFNFIMKYADGIINIDDNTEEKLKAPIIYNWKEKSLAGC